MQHRFAPQPRKCYWSSLLHPTSSAQAGKTRGHGVISNGRVHAWERGVHVAYISIALSRPHVFEAFAPHSCDLKALQVLITTRQWLGTIGRPCLPCSRSALCCRRSSPPLLCRRRLGVGRATQKARGPHASLLEVMSAVTHTTGREGSVSGAPLSASAVWPMSRHGGVGSVGQTYCRPVPPHAMMTRSCMHVLVCRARRGRTSERDRDGSDSFSSRQKPWP